MKKVVPFAKARETSLYGSKAVGLGDAARHGLPLRPAWRSRATWLSVVGGGQSR